MSSKFENYINRNKIKYERPKYTAKYNAGGFTHSIDICDTQKNTCFYLEPAHNGIAPITVQSCQAPEEGSDWECDVVDFLEISRSTYGQGNSDERTAASSMIPSFRSTAEARFISISPSYIKVKAKFDFSNIRISSPWGGEIFCLQGGEMPFLVRPGSFIMCEQGVCLGTRLIDGENETLITNEVGFKGFMVIRGEGLCFLQAGDFLDIWELEPGEVVLCNPKLLMGITESVHMKGLSSTSPDPAVRRIMGMEYELILKADERGGIVCCSNLPQML